MATLLSLITLKAHLHYREILAWLGYKWYGYQKNVKSCIIYTHGSFSTVPTTAKIMFWWGAGLKFLVSILELTAMRMWSYSVKMAV